MSSSRNNVANLDPLQEHIPPRALLRFRASRIILLPSTVLIEGRHQAGSSIGGASQFGEPESNTGQCGKTFTYGKQEVNQDPRVLSGIENRNTCAL